MSRYTPSYSNLLSRLSEVEDLLKIASDYERADPINQGSRIGALCRSSVVLLSSHIEGYITELGELILDKIYKSRIKKDVFKRQFFYYFSQDIINDIKNSGEPSKVANNIFSLHNRDHDIWGHKIKFDEPLPADRFNRGFANPRFKKISKYLNRFGYGQFKDDLARHLTRDYQVCVTMIDNIVNQRNMIAHGDINVQKTPQDVEEMLKLTRVFCRATDVVVANWCKSNICPIRN
jgi:hypothetical protein